MALVIQRTLVTLALLIGPVQGMAMSKTDVREEDIPAFVFTEHCAGRYQLVLPADMKLIDSGYNDELILTSVYPPEEKVHDTAYSGEGRIELWRERVEAERQKEIVETGYVHESLEGSLKTLVYYADRRKIPGMREDPDEWHKFEAFFLKDFSEMEKAVAIRGQRSEEHTSELQSRPHLVC